MCATPHSELQDLQRCTFYAYSNVLPTLPEHLSDEVLTKIQICIVAKRKKFEERIYLVIIGLFFFYLLGAFCLVTVQENHKQRNMRFKDSIVAIYTHEASFRTESMALCNFVFHFYPIQFHFPSRNAHSAFFHKVILKSASPILAQTLRMIIAMCHPLWQNIYQVKF